MGVLRHYAAALFIVAVLSDTRPVTFDDLRNALPAPHDSYTVSR